MSAAELRKVRRAIDSREKELEGLRARRDALAVAEAQRSGNVSATATAAGLSRQYLHRLIPR